MSDSIQRLCKKCSTSYPLTSEFWHKNKSDPNGLNRTCKECTKARSRQWHADNREYANNVNRQWKAANTDRVKEYNAENAEHIAGLKREWRKNNPDKVAAQKKRSAQRCKPHINAYHREWYKRNKKRLTENITPEQRAANSARACAWAKANPEKALNNFHKRRALLRGNGGDGFTKADKNLQLRSQKGLCWWCSKSMGLDITIDHIVAIKRGGKHDPRNIVLCHLTCNCSKKDKLPQEWAGRLF